MINEYKIYVDKEIIYTGDLHELPELHRDSLVSAFTDWASVLSKGALNELIYSMLYWYHKTQMYCTSCNRFFDDGEKCSDCGSGLREKYLYDRNKEIDKILDCVGMITSVEILKK